MIEQLHQPDSTQRRPERRAPQSDFCSGESLLSALLGILSASALEEPFKLSRIHENRS